MRAIISFPKNSKCIVVIFQKLFYNYSRAWRQNKWDKKSSEKFFGKILLDTENPGLEFWKRNFFAFPLYWKKGKSWESFKVEIFVRKPAHVEVSLKNMCGIGLVLEEAEIWHGRRREDDGKRVFSRKVFLGECGGLHSWIESFSASWRGGIFSKNLYRPGTLRFFGKTPPDRFGNSLSSGREGHLPAASSSGS